MYLKHIKELREDHDLTQKALAQHLNITQRAYSYYENGDRNIPIEILIKLANYYQISIDALIGRTYQKETNISQ